MSLVHASIARGLAIFLGVFTLLNVAGDLRFRGSDANLWWIDFTPLPAWASRLVLVLLAIVLLANERHIEAKGLILLTLLFAAANAIHFYVLLAKRAIHSSVPIPFSLVIVAALTSSSCRNGSRRAAVRSSSPLSRAPLHFPSHRSRSSARPTTGGRRT